jgi:hypothetical protein
MERMSLAKAKRELRDALRRGAGDVLLKWPIYDAWRRRKNAEARRLYEQEGARMAPTAVEAAVIGDLQRDGIAMVQLSDLVTEPPFEQIREWAEALVSAPAMRERITSIESGAKPEAKGGKYYIVRPLGDCPAFDVQDTVLRAVLSDPILRVVSGYLGMFSRITALDLWYNVPTDGPETLSQRWHRDPEDRALVKTFLYLRDCDEASGPFCYVPGSHNAGPLQHKVGGYNYPDDGAIDRQFSAQQRKVCTGKAGTLIFCDTTGFHKGGHATTGSRFLFNTVYTTNASEPIARRWTPHCTVTSSSSDLSAAARYAVGFVQAGSQKGFLEGLFA